MYVWSITAVNKAYKLFEDEEQVKYCETIVEEARSQLETKVNCYLNYISKGIIDKYTFSVLVSFRAKFSNYNDTKQCIVGRIPPRPYPTYVKKSHFTE